MRTRIWIVGLGVLIGLMLKITFGDLSNRFQQVEKDTDANTAHVQAVEPAE